MDPMQWKLLLGKRWRGRQGIEKGSPDLVKQRKRGPAGHRGTVSVEKIRFSIGCAKTIDLLNFVSPISVREFFWCFYLSSTFQDAVLTWSLPAVRPP